MHIEFPLHFDASGRTAGCDDPNYVRQLIEMVLFSGPGERVNRPDFGAGLRGLVFAPNSEELAAALQFAVQSNLRRWLNTLVDVTALSVTAEDETLRVEVSYALRRTGAKRTEEFTATV
jgi:phage baseplate assembly protein W